MALFKFPKLNSVRSSGTDFEGRTLSYALQGKKLPERRNEVEAAVGPLPLGMPWSTDLSAGLGGRMVPSDALADYYYSLPQKLTPKQVWSILRAALAGNMWQQQQLTQLMRDTWPMFRKCEFELRSAVSAVNFVAEPYAEPGQEPTKTAVEKAALVNRAINSFRPDRFQDEDGWQGMLFDIGDMIVNGISICELVYNEDAVDPDGNKETNVRASCWVHPRHYNFTTDGMIGVAQSNANYTSFGSQMQSTTRIIDEPNKFIIARFKSKSGSSLGAGFMRCLSFFWVMIVFGYESVLIHSQKYGNPFLDVAYESGGVTDNDIAKFIALAKQAVAQGYFVHPNKTTATISDAKGMGANDAKIAMMRLADEYCMMVMLGQTLTSQVSKEGGSRAQADVHQIVRTDKIEELASNYETILTEQFVTSLLEVNYGESSERPNIVADFTEELTPEQQAQWLTSMSQSSVPLPTKAAYRKLGFQPPVEGDQVFWNGKIGQIGDTESELPTTAEDDLAQQQQHMEMQQSFAQPEGEPAQAHAKVHKILVKASDKELDELEPLVIKAANAPHQNGEWKDVRHKLKQIQLNHR